MLDIRSRTDYDLAGCAEVLRDVYAKDGYPVQGTSNAKEFLNDGKVTHAWIAELEGSIVGHICTSLATDDDVSVALWRQQHPDDQVAVLGRLFVQPDARSAGTATRLIEAVMAWARSVRHRLVLFALMKDQGAMRLYERLGWINFGTVPYPYGHGQQMDAVCFVSPGAA